MSNVIYEHIKKYPDFYVDKEPAIVRELPNKKKIFLPGYATDGDYKWFLLLNRLVYFLTKDGKIFKAKLSEEGYRKTLEAQGLDPDAEWSIEPEEI